MKSTGSQGQWRRAEDGLELEAGKSKETISVMAQWEEARLHGGNLNLNSSSTGHLWESGPNQFTRGASVSSSKS